MNTFNFELITLEIEIPIEFIHIPKYHYYKYNNLKINIMNSDDNDTKFIMNIINYNLNLYKYLFNFKLFINKPLVIEKINIFSFPRAREIYF